MGDRITRTAIELFWKIGNNLILLQANGGYEVYDINNKNMLGRPWI